MALAQGTPAPEFATPDAMLGHYAAVEARVAASAAAHARRAAEAERLRQSAAQALVDAAREAASRVAVAARRQDADARGRLATYVMPAPEPRTHWRALIGRIAAWHGLTEADVLGDSRKAPALAARFDAIVAVHLAYPAISLPRLGQIFGGRDHTTILNALRKRGIVSANATRCLSVRIPGNAPLAHDPRPRRHWQLLVARIAAWHGLPEDDLIGPGQTAALVSARYDAIIAVHLAYPDISSKGLARMFGDRDHTTILRAFRVRGLRPANGSAGGAA